jgi:hypothetical protein
LTLDVCEIDTLPDVDPVPGTDTLGVVEYEDRIEKVGVDGGEIEVDMKDEIEGVENMVRVLEVVLETHEVSDVVIDALKVIIFAEKLGDIEDDSELDSIADTEGDPVEFTVIDHSPEFELVAEDDRVTRATERVEFKEEDDSGVFE